MKRNTIVLGAGVAVVAVGGWFAYDRFFSSGVNAGAGPYYTLLQECQKTIFEDTQEPDDLKFLENTVWHAGTPDNLNIGGKFTRFNDAGRKATFNYECLIRNNRVIDAGRR
ncbi:MAG: hypothetical protein FJX64_04980 [Alphaproteobacteria bacterium]|nr:hypothetical protein [Alphaproteobacteria bacterium]